MTTVADILKTTDDKSLVIFNAIVIPVTTFKHPSIVYGGRNGDYRRGKNCRTVDMSACFVDYVVNFGMTDTAAGWSIY